MKTHECKRFKTVMKRSSIRHTVACRQCGKKRLATPMHDLSGPVGMLP